MIQSGIFQLAVSIESLLPDTNLKCLQIATIIWTKTVVLSTFGSHLLPLGKDWKNSREQKASGGGKGAKIGVVNYYRLCVLTLASVCPCTGKCQTMGYLAVCPSQHSLFPDLIQQNLHSAFFNNCLLVCASLLPFLSFQSSFPTFREPLRGDRYLLIDFSIFPFPCILFCSHPVGFWADSWTSCGSSRSSWPDSTPGVAVHLLSPTQTMRGVHESTRMLVSLPTGSLAGLWMFFLSPRWILRFLLALFTFICFMSAVIPCVPFSFCTPACLFSSTPQLSCFVVFHSGSSSEW